jgi:hypothetical protein
LRDYHINIFDSEKDDGYIAAFTMVVSFVVLPLLFLGIGSPAISFIIPTLIAVSVWCARPLSRESREVFRTLLVGALPRPGLQVYASIIGLKL